MCEAQVLSPLPPAYTGPKKGSATHYKPYFGSDKRPSTAYLRHLCQHYSRGCDLVVSVMSGKDVTYNHSNLVINNHFIPPLK